MAEMSWAERQQMIQAAALLGSGIPELQQKIVELEAAKQAQEDELHEIVAILAAVEGVEKSA